MDKSRVFNQVILRLQEDLDQRRQAANQARLEATDEQLKSENKYDTRSLEASYLARGHALSTGELESDLQALRALVLPGAGPQPAAGPGMLVQVVFGRSPEWYFLLPCAGGVEFQVDETRVTVVTPASLLGKKLAGLRAGGHLVLRAGGIPGRIAQVK